MLEPMLIRKRRLLLQVFELWRAPHSSHVILGEDRIMVGVIAALSSNAKLICFVLAIHLCEMVKRECQL